VIFADLEGAFCRAY